MLDRSIPGYASILRMIGMLAARFVTDHRLCWDLGCSLGAASLAMAHQIQAADCRVIGVDNSPAMLTRAKTLIQTAQPSTPISLYCQDIVEIPLENAGMVVLNFTLQFVPPKEREALLAKVYQAMVPGAVLVLSEKVAFDDAFQDLFVDMHHEFKRAQGYSELEISQKRTALERVLIPETLETHLKRLQRVGFSQVRSGFQCFNFLTFVAIK
jgi:tRNA (cmo5U34)-methyltransferase